MKRVVKSKSIEPKSIKCAAKTIALYGGERSTGGTKSTSPFRRWVDGGPFIGNMTDGKESREQGDGERRGRAVDVCGLTGIVGNELDGVGERTELCIGGLKQDG